MEFRTYKDANGGLKGQAILYDGELREHTPGEPWKKPTPGTFLTYVSTGAMMDVRTGIVVGTHEDSVDVLWNEWLENPSIGYGELRKRLGIKSGSQRKKDRWEAKKLAKYGKDMTPSKKRRKDAP